MRARVAMRLRVRAMAEEVRARVAMRLRVRARVGVSNPSPNRNPNPNPNPDPNPHQVREHMAQMGFRTFEEMVGRADMLRVDESALHPKSATLDLGPILTPAASLAPGEPQFNAQVRVRARDRVSPNPSPNPNPDPDPTLSGLRHAAGRRGGRGELGAGPLLQGGDDARRAG